MEGVNFLSEDLQNDLLARNQDLRWATYDKSRSQRWEHLFNPNKVKQLVEAEDGPEMAAMAADRFDLMKDPVLDHYKVSPAERMRRQWLTEHCLDNMLRAQHNQLNDSGILTETTQASAIASFTTWALPLVRHYLPRQFIHQIVPTYPMSQPTGYLFTADNTYGSGGTYASGTSIYGNPDPAYADDDGECDDPNELNFTITSSNITAISKKLKGVWSIEAAQNLASYHKLVMENEVVRMLGIEIEREINRYCINQLVANAATITNWNSTQPMAATSAWSNATPKEYQESLWDAIEDANRAIKDAQFVNGNFLLCGTTFASRLRKLNGFRLAYSDDAVQSEVVTGPNLFGVLNGRYVVYEDVDFPGDKCLIGHKPSSWMYTGACYNPYVPMWRTPVIHTVTMCPGVGYLTRFAFTVVNGSFYGVIVVS